MGRTGNGKTALATDEGRKLVGDHEHGWTADGRTHGYGDVDGVQQRFTVDHTGYVTGFVMIPGGKS